MTATCHGCGRPATQHTARQLSRHSPRIGDTRACPDCGRPQHYTGTELGWCHDALIGTWDCADPAKAGA